MGRPRSDIAPRVVHAARARFLLEGVDGASLRDIAKDAKTSVGMVYYYFPTKDDLFLAVVEEIYAGLLAGLEIALAPDVSVQRRFARAFARIGGASDVEIDVIRLVVREALVSSTRLDRLLDRFRRGHLPMLLAALAEGVDKGEVRSDRPLPLLMMSIFGAGLVPQMLRRFAGDRLPFSLLPEGEELSKMLVEVVFGGVGTAPSREP